MLNSSAKKIGIVLIVVFIILPLLYFGYSSIKNRPGDGTKVTIFAIPSSSKVTIDDVEQKGKVAYLKPGSYKVKASFEGFETIDSTFIVTDQERTVVLPLAPVSDSAKKFAKDNQKQYLKAEEIEGQRADEAGQKLTEASPILTRLPYTTTLYTISYGRRENVNEIYIKIDSLGPIGRQVALQQIREWGYEPANYKIVFAGLTNPFDDTITEGGL